jgi:O-antigen/teichoic acid export membrane protein
MTEPAGTRRRLLFELLSSYGASATRVLSWAIVSGLLYRFAGRDAFATFALIRATLGILNYITLGVGPALLHRLPRSDDPAPVLAAGRQIASGALLFGLFLSATASAFANQLLSVGGVSATVCTLLLGAAMTLRLVSDAAGAVLQSRGRIVLDNLLLVLADVAWVMLLLALPIDRRGAIESAGWTLLVASTALLAARLVFSGQWRRPVTDPPPIVRRSLLRFGVAVTLTQLAEFLYAPAAHVLIRLFISPPSVLADYSAATQIDAALLLAVAGIGTVLLPRASIAAASGQLDRVRRMYLYATGFALATLGLAASLTWLLAPWLLRSWFGSDMPGTLSILPLVLVHTVLGGTAVAGRAVLIAMGRVRALTWSVLLAGGSNVLLGLAAVTLTDFGIRGIVVSTIVVVFARCGLWMPWYVLRRSRTSS